MLIAEARVETGRSSRYLVQLCQHVNKAGRAHPQMDAHVEWSDADGVISLGRGRCILHADIGVLTLRAEAPDEANLRQVERRVADRLERIGRRDQLTVTWTSPADAGEPIPVGPPAAPAEDRHLPGQPRYPDAGGIGVGSDRDGGLPRWAKVVALIVAILALLIIIVMLLPGGHGPGRHGASDGPAGPVEQELAVDHAPPEGGRG